MNFIVPRIKVLLEIVLSNLLFSMCAYMMFRIGKLNRIAFRFLYHTSALVSFIVYVSSQVITLYYETDFFWDLPIDCKEIMPEKNLNSIFYFSVFKMMPIFFIMVFSGFYLLTDGSFAIVFFAVLLWKMTRGLPAFPNENERPNDQEENELRERLRNVLINRVNNVRAAGRREARGRVQAQNQQRDWRNGPPPAYEEIQDEARTVVPEPSTQEHTLMDQEAPPAYEEVSRDGAPPPYEDDDNNVMVIGIWHPRGNQREETEGN
ncbi:hypothetical protein B9Z55_024746 [Caenorhabditis nigoni]|nr:hypothetical protein B9Z55_024746 [Caenorhabditis nigoni]